MGKERERHREGDLGGRKKRPRSAHTNSHNYALGYCNVLVLCIIRRGSVRGPFGLKKSGVDFGRASSCVETINLPGISLRCYTEPQLLCTGTNSTKCALAKRAQQIRRRVCTVRVGPAESILPPWLIPPPARASQRGENSPPSPGVSLQSPTQPKPLHFNNSAAGLENRDDKHGSCANDSYVPLSVSKNVPTVLVGVALRAIGPSKRTRRFFWQPFLSRVQFGTLAPRVQIKIRETYNFAESRARGRISAF